MTEQNESRAPSDEGEGDEVGYGKPPVHSRWKPGQSGNPKGRPKKERSIKKLIERELDRVITIKNRGKEERITIREAIVRKRVSDALSDPRERHRLIAMIEDDDSGPDLFETREDEEALQELLRRSEQQEDSAD